MAEKHYEMQWDCQFCGTKKLLGKTHRYCSNCGAPQNPDSRYYPSDEEKVAVEDHVFVGADVACPACSTLNAGNSEFCQQCGSPLKGGKQASTLSAEARAEGAAFENSGSRDVTKEKFDAEMQRIGVTKPEGGGGIPRWLIIGAVVVVAAIGFFIWWTNRTVATTALVTGREWERVIQVQEYQQFTVESWWDVRPAGNEVTRLTCRTAQRSTRQIPDGETCSTVRTDRGDGTFSESEVCSPKYRSEPVYDDLCTWRVNDWRDDRQVVTNGDLKVEPVWGNPQLNCANQTTLGCERESGRNETYNLLLQATLDGESYSYKCAEDATGRLTQAEWAAVGIETVFNLEVYANRKNDAKCDTLKP